MPAQALSASPEIHWSNVDTAPCGDGISVAEVPHHHFPEFLHHAEKMVGFT